jgi:signal peptidase I
MPELSGSLVSIEIAPILRFLSGLGKSGDLLVSRGRWLGQLSLDQGRLTAAAIEHESGGPALEFIALALRGGDFEFSEGAPTLSPNLGGLDNPLQEIDRQAGRSPDWLMALPAPTAIPRLLDPAVRGDEDGEVALGRSALYVLLDVDGQRSVRDLAARHGLLRAVSALSRLRQLGLVDFGSADADASLPDRAGVGRSRGSSSPGQPRPENAGSTVRSSLGGGLPAPGGVTPGGAGVGVLGRPPVLALPLEALRRRLERWGATLLHSGLIQTVLATAVCVVAIRGVIQNFRVEGVSMEPNFEGGQVLVVNRLAYLHLDQGWLISVLPSEQQGSTRYLFGGPQHGDVVIFRAPPQPDTDYIKRVIGVPGDRVLIQSGHVTVNGTILDEPYIEFPADYTYPEDGQPLVVPDGEYFVLGDNRPESFDSHTGWLVPVDNLIGRAWVRYWPPNALQVVQAASR